MADGKSVTVLGGLTARPEAMYQLWYDKTTSHGRRTVAARREFFTSRPATTAITTLAIGVMMLLFGAGRALCTRVVRLDERYGRSRTPSSTPRGVSFGEPPLEEYYGAANRHPRLAPGDLRFFRAPTQRNDVRALRPSGPLFGGSPLYNDLGAARLAQGCTPGWKEVSTLSGWASLGDGHAARHR